MTSRNRSLLLAVAILVIASLAVFAAACGGSDATTTTTAPQTTTTAAAAPDTTAAPATDTTAAAAPASGTIIVKGMVDNPVTLTADSLKAMNPVTLTADHPKLGPTEYTGVKWSDILTLVKPQSGATLVNLICSDGFIAEVAIVDIQASADSMIAIAADGTLNGVMPGMGGKAWAKDIVTIDFK